MLSIYIPEYDGRSEGIRAFYDFKIEQKIEIRFALTSYYYSRLNLAVKTNLKVVCFLDETLEQK